MKARLACPEAQMRAETTVGPRCEPTLEVICVVVVREPRGALRAEDTVPGWGDMPYEQLPAEQLMHLGRS